MKSLVHTEELCSQSMPLEHAPGAKYIRVYPSRLTAARLAQLGERRSAEREVASSNPGWTNTQGLKNN